MPFMNCFRRTKKSIYTSYHKAKSSAGFSDGTVISLLQQLSQMRQLESLGAAFTDKHVSLRDTQDVIENLAEEEKTLKIVLVVQVQHASEKFNTTVRKTVALVADLIFFHDSMSLNTEEW